MLDLTECYTPKDPHMYVLLVNGEIVRGKKKSKRENCWRKKGRNTQIRTRKALSISEVNESVQRKIITVDRVLLT